MGHKPTLLCVDDDVQCLAIRKIMFEAFGFKVTTTPDPRQALRLHAAKRFDAAVVDYQMPHMNGAEVAKSMKVTRPEVPVVILSGMPYLPEGTPEYHDRFYCKTESAMKLAREIQHLIANYPPNSNSGHPALSRRILATAGIIFGFATQGFSEVRHRFFHGPSLAKSMTAAAL